MVPAFNFKLNFKLKWDFARVANSVQVEHDKQFEQLQVPVIELLVLGSRYYLSEVVKVNSSQSGNSRT